MIKVSKGKGKVQESGGIVLVTVTRRVRKAIQEVMNKDEYRNEEWWRGTNCGIYKMIYRNGR